MVRSAEPENILNGEVSMKHKLVLFSLLLFIAGSPVFSFAAGWELYDDFSSGSFDPVKWQNNSDGVVSTITVEGGQAKFVHHNGNPNMHRSLNLIQNPANILGIRASILISACTGDARMRIYGYSASFGGGDIWTGLQLQPEKRKIITSSGIQGPPPAYTFEDLHFAEFKRPLDLIGNTYNASMVFGSDNITYEVDGLGRIIYKYPAAATPSRIDSKGFSTRSNSGEGPCTSYIDDVYVLRP